MIVFTLQKICLRNVRCYGDEVMEMDFPINNLTVFTGHVGAGKSTIVKAVSMALYGEDGGVKGEKLSIDDMVNERTGKNLEIHLYFTAVDSANPDSTDNYEIHLYHKHNLYGSKIVFMKNGVDISANGKLDTYRLIEKTIIPKDVYHNIYYFTQQAKNFFTALPNSEQKAIFDSILDLSEYDGYYENAKDKESQIHDQLSLETERYNSARNSVMLYDKAIADMKSRLEDAKKQDSALICDEERKEKSLLELLDVEKQWLSANEEEAKRLFETEQKKYQDEKFSLEKQKDECSSSLYELKNQFRERFTSEKTKIAESYKLLNEEYVNKIQSLKDSILELTKEKSLSDQQIADYAHKEEKQIREDFQKKIESINDSISQIRVDMSDLANEYQKLRFEKKTELSKEINDLQVETNEFRISTIPNLEHEVKEYDRAINDLTKEIDEETRNLAKDVPVCKLCGQPVSDKNHIIKHLEDLKKELADCREDRKDSLHYVTKYKHFAEHNEEVIKELTTKEAEELAAIDKELQEKQSSKQTELSALMKDLDTIKSDIKEKVAESQRSAEIATMKVESDYQSKLTSINDTINKHQSEIDKNNADAANKLSELKTNLENEYSREAAIIDSKSKEISDKIVKLDQNQNDKYRSYSLEIEAWRKVRSMEHDLATIRQRINDLKSKTYSEYDDSSLRKDKVKYEEETSVIEKKIHELKEDLEIASFWKTSFSNTGIKSMLIDSAIPHMNQCVREELDRVAPGVFTVSFDTLSQTKSGNIRDKFSINIVHNLKGSTGHKKLSGGEKRIVDLCCMTALRSLAENLYGKKFSHIFYDEILDSLDTECKEQFCRNAKLQSQSGMNITLITHDLPDDVDPDRVLGF